MAIDITRVLDQFNRNDFASYVNDFIPAGYFYQRFYPTLYQPTLTFEALQEDFGAAVAADVVAFDSRAPRKGRQMPGKVTGDIPKVEIARPKEESDIKLYQMLQDASARATGNAAASVMDRLIQFMYGDADFCQTGVHARMEYLAKQVTSRGKFALTIANNAGGIATAVDIDFGIPGGNITSVGVDWDTTSTATPVADIRTVYNAARTAGKILRFAVTDRATFDRMVLTADVQKFTASFALNALNLASQQTPTIETVNTALRNQNLPQFVIWDSFVNLESKAGVLGATTGWQDGNIMLCEDINLGATPWTETADDLVNIDDSVKANNDFILVKTWAEQDPITIVTKAVAYAVPILNKAKNRYILQTQL
jgi:hypothetical protein